MKDMLQCPLCGQWFGIRAMWTHMPEAHGIEPPPGATDHWREWFCVCGAEFKTPHGRAQHFRRNSRKCMVQGMLGGVL